MTLLYMLDSNYCIRLLRNRPSGARERFKAETGRICISAIVLHELLFSAEKSDRVVENRAEVAQLISRLVVLPFDEDAATHSGEIRAVLQRAGMTIGTLDVMIAGHARSQGLVVVTNKMREFQRVDGLRIEDWQ